MFVKNMISGFLQQQKNLTKIYMHMVARGLQYKAYVQLIAYFGVR